MINIEEIINNYKKYGFEHKQKMSRNEYLVFTFRSGFFYNAEIVELTDENCEYELSKTIQELQNAGITAKITKFRDIEHIKNRLFHGFFDTNRWKEKIKDEYKQFVERTLNSLPNEKPNI